MVLKPDRKDILGITENNSLILASSRLDLNIDLGKNDETRNIGNFEDGDLAALRPTNEWQAHSHHKVAFEYQDIATGTFFFWVSKSCVLTPRDASGWAFHWESSSFVPWFAPSVIRSVYRVIPEWQCISWFWRKSSSRDRAPQIRLSVSVNSWDNFLVCLPSSSFDTWAI